MFLLSLSENILLFIAGVGIVQAIFLVILLIVHPKSDMRVNRFLALFISAISLPMVLPVAQNLFSWQTMIFIEPLLTLIAPMLYFYVRSFKEKITWKKAWPHFILFLVCIPLAFVDYYAVGDKFPRASTIPIEASSNLILVIPLSVRFIQRITYYFLCRKELNCYQRSIKHLYSETSRIDLNWMRYLINGYLILIFLSLITYSLMIKVPSQFGLWVLISAITCSFYIYLATIKGIAQSTLWQLTPEANHEKVALEIENATQLEAEAKGSEKPRPRKAGLNEAKIDELVAKVIYLMDSEKLYQEPELTLQQLAVKLNTTPHHLSQAINDGLKKNFYDLVNTYRVEEAKRLLLDPKNVNYTILSVGFEAGFNSKTTFNTVFKKFTGVTPTEFRYQQNTQLAPA